MDKPPIGIMPRFLWDEWRHDELRKAINRYLEAGIRPNQEWFNELNELYERINARAVKHGEQN